jgi:16S rRNA (adenine1518-N6/adenine1519-N6)-dimethyltransferase
MMSNARRRPLTADRGPIKSPRHRPRKRYGQHFLEPAWAEKLVKAIDPQPDDRFLEIGPGPGALTMRLAPRVAHLTAVEIDRDIVAALASQVPPNVEIVEGDFLEMDLGPLAKGGRLRVAGNLPYNISSPILFALLEFSARTQGARDAVLMLQKEVADRLVAKVGTGDYGVLTVLTAVHADVTRVLSLPPGAFRPPPKVHSAVVRLAFRPPKVPISDQELFVRMVRTMFTQRRKTAANALKAFAVDRGLDAAQTLTGVGIDPQRRPETLELAEMAALCNAFARPFFTDPPSGLNRQPK